jgi:type I restriction enzyme S subunit
MNAERLLVHYEQIADAPDAIGRLRRFILDLAVRGKLVPQDPKDEPAAELLKRIAKEKARLLKEGGKRKEPIVAELAGGNIFDVPSGWEWVPFGEVHQLIRGVTYSKSDVSELPDKGFLPVLRANNIGIRLTHDDPVFVKQERISPEQLLRQGDFMIALSSGSKNLVGKAAFVPEDFNEGFGGFCGVIRLIDPSLRGFVGVYLQADLYRDRIAAGSRGIGINNLKMETISNLHFPLPPLAEQHRIVAKVDELMGLCDRLEAARAEREATRDRLVASGLARLNAPDPETFQADARFVLNALPALTTRPDQIKQLRQAILNLAVRGKLVPQDPNDEPASVLLERARNAKSLLRVERRIGRSEDPECSNSSGEADAPEHWAWAYLADFALVLGGKRLPAGASFAKEPTGHIYIRVTDMKGGTISDKGVKFISPEVQKKISKYTIDQDDIYITIAGTIGEVGIVPAMFHGQNLTENAAKIVFRGIYREFLILVLCSDDVKNQFTEKTKQMAQPKLALKRILGAKVPLPPLAEQHRIVAKVNALMALCHRLEASLTATVTTRRRLLDALLAEALAPADACKLEAAE